MSARAAARNGFGIAAATVLSAALAAMIHTPAICTRGEAREGLVVRDIVRAGRWALPVRNGILASKPPLYHWIAAVSTQVLGLSDAVVRLPSALAALLVVGLTFALGAFMGGRRRAWLALGVLLGCFMFWRAAVEARVDMVFTAGITTSLAGFWWWHESGAMPARLACYLGAAAAVLTKGPAGAVLPGLVIGVFLVSRRDWRRLRDVGASPLLLLATVPVALWYALAYQAGGDAFVARQLWSENVDRFVGRSEFAHRRDHPLSIVGQFLGHLFPWNLTLLSGWRDGGDGRDAAGARYLHVWWIVILAVFTIGAGKRSVYLLPAYPAVALLAARWLDRHVRMRAAWLATAMVLVDLAVGFATHARRTTIARADRLRALASDIRRTLPPDTTLAAAPGTSENDVLVLSYLLDRPIRRARVGCRPASAWLVPVDEGPAIWLRNAIGCSAGTGLPHTAETGLVVCNSAEIEPERAARCRESERSSDSATSSRPARSDP